MSGGVCEYCAQGTQHPLYLYVVRCSTPEEVHVGLSSNPFVRVKQLNFEPGHTKPGKWAKAGNKQWQLVLVIGPFETPEEARAAGAIRDQSNRKASKRVVCIARLLAKKSTWESSIAWHSDLDRKEWSAL